LDMRGARAPDAAVRRVERRILAGLVTELGKKRLQYRASEPFFLEGVARRGGRRYTLDKREGKDTRLLCPLGRFARNEAGFCFLDGAARGGK
jgi:hypothetical protein